MDTADFSKTTEYIFTAALPGVQHKEVWEDDDFVKHGEGGGVKGTLNVPLSLLCV